MDNINERMTALELSIPSEYLQAPIWLAWVCDGWSDESRCKKNKKVLLEDGRLGHISKKDDLWFEQLMTFEEAVIRLQEESTNTWWDCGVGLYNYRGLTIGVVDVDDKAHDSEFGGIKETSVSGDYHYIGLAVVERSYDWAGGQVIGDGGKWIALTGRIVGGQWGALRLPERLSSGGHTISPTSSVEALREAFLASKQGNRHNSLYAYCRAVQCALIASETRDVGIYTTVIKKTVLAHPEYSKDWNWQQTALNIWQSKPHDNTVIAHAINQVEAQAVDAFAVVSPAEVAKIVKDYVPTQQKQVQDFVRAEPVEYWKLIEEEYKPVRVVRDIFLEQVAFQRQDGRWAWVDSREVKAVMKSKIRKMGKEERQARGFVVDGAEDFLTWWAKDYREVGLRANIADWDGRDRLKELADALNPVDPRLTPDCVEYFVKDWAVKAWGKIYNSQVQNRMILLQGSQGIGKDSWAIALAGGFGAHFGVPALMSAKYLNEQQLARVVADKAVCLFDEFDKLAGAEALIKALITKRHFDIEVKFENNPARVEHRCSYIGTTNSSVFSDSTGNRRFLFFELAGGVNEAIQFCFPNPDSVAIEAYQSQVLAQGYYLYKTQGVGRNETFEAIMQAIQQEVTPEDAGSEIVESFDELVARKIRDNASFNQPWKRFFSASELREVFTALARDYNVTTSQIKTTVKKHGRYGRIGLGLNGQGGQARVYSLKENFNDKQMIEQYFNKDDCPF